MRVPFRAQAFAALLGLSLLTLVLIVGAGGSGAAPARPGDTYVEAMVGMPRFVNPLLASGDTDTDLTHLVYSGLTRVDERGEIVPDLASDWQVAADARVFTFTLRPDAQWHDGAPLTSDDVLFTTSLVKDKDFPGSPTLAEVWQRVEVDVPNPRTVRFTLYEPNASFLQHTTMGILPRHIWSDVKAGDLAYSELNRSPVGSGPWRYASMGDAAADPGLSDVPGATLTQPVQTAAGVILEPNPAGANRRAGISRLWLRYYPTFGAALTGFQMGEVHGLGHIPQDRLPELTGVQGVTLHTQTLARYAMLILNTRSPLLDRSETRRAIEQAIDRQALVDAALPGQARTAGSPVLAQSWAYDPQSKHSGAQPAEAKRLLDAAGWKLDKDGVRHREGVTLTLVLAASNEMPQNVEVARQIGQQLEAVGVDVQLALVERDTLLRDYLAPGSFHIVLANWQAAGADPDLYDYWHSSQATPGSLNFAGWNNEKADKALAGSRTTPDKALRAAHFSAFQQAFRDDPPSVILYNPLYTYATRSPAAGVTLPSTDLVSPAQRFDTLEAWYLDVE